MRVSLSLLKAFSNLTKSDPNPALMASLCGFAALQLGLGFHYTEESKRGEGGVDRWMVGGNEGQKAPGEEDKENFIQWVDVIKGNREKQAENRREEVKLVVDRCEQIADGWRKDSGLE